MSLTSAMIDALLAAGGTAEQLAALVKADLAEQDARKASKREGNAERQRRFKANRKSRLGNADNALPRVTPPIEEIIPPEQSSPNGESCLAKKRLTRPHPLPDDWQPALTPAAQRIVAPWQPGRLERAVNSFRDHAADKGRVSKDWQAAFRKWIENEDKWNPGNGRLSAANDSRGIRGTRPDPALDMYRQAQRDLQAEAERESAGFGQPAWPALPAH